MSIVNEMLIDNQLTEFRMINRHSKHIMAKL